MKRIKQRTKTLMKRIGQGIKAFCERFISLVKTIQEMTLLLSILLFLVQFILIVLLISLCWFFIAVVLDHYPDWIVKLDMGGKGETLRFIGIAMGGVLLAIQATVSYRRAKAMEDTVKQTEQGQRQERLKNAIEHLEHERSFMHLGGAYELFHLAEDTEALRKTILEIFCAHIRQTTGSEAYQKEYEEKPSEEIQSLLTLLFVQDHKVFRDCHINLQGSWLNGASLREARLQKADLRRVQLQGAVLSLAQLQWADLSEAQLQGADFRSAQLWDVRLQGADLRKAQLQRAILNLAQLQRAELRNAQLQEAVLSLAQLQGANLSEAQLQGAALNHAQLQEADLSEAHLQGAKLNHAQLQGAKLNHAQLHGADLPEAQLQGADLSEAQLQAANLMYAHLQGAKLRKTQLQGAMLFEAQLQEADFSETQLQGIVSSYDANQPYLSLDFADRIQQRVGQESDLSTVVSSVDLMSEKEVNTGSYTQKDADQWIAEYKKAFSRDDVHS